MVFFCHPTPTPPFSNPIHFFDAKERVINEFCLCYVAEIHLLVSYLFIYLFILIPDTLWWFCIFSRVCAPKTTWKMFSLPRLSMHPHQFICPAGACPVWPVCGAASGTPWSTHAVIWTMQWMPTSSRTARFVCSCIFLACFFQYIYAFVTTSWNYNKLWMCIINGCNIYIYKINHIYKI